jgi:hypothetical protein
MKQPPAYWQEADFEVERIALTRALRDRSALLG